METPKKGSGSAPSTPRKLENMSPEELIKNSKKQMVLLQKLKAKCDELQAKLKQKSDYDEIKLNLSDAETKLNGSSQELTSLKDSEAKLKQLNSSLTEELECIKMKQETLLTSLQYLQNDFNSASQEKETLLKTNQESQVMQKELKEKFAELQNERQDSTDQLHDKTQQLVALKDHIKKITASDEKLQETNKSLQTENKEIRNELAALKITLDMFKSTQKSSDDKSSEKIAELNKTVQTLTAKLLKFKEIHQKLKGEFAQTIEEKDIQQLECDTAKERCFTLQEKLESMTDTKDELETSLQTKETQLKDADDKINKMKEMHKENFEKLKQEFEDLLQRNETLSTSNKQLSSHEKELEHTLSESTRCREAVEEELKSLKSKMHDLNLKLSELELQQTNVSSDELDRLSKVVDEQSNEINVHKENLKKLVAENAALKKSLEDISLDKQNILKESHFHKERWAEVVSENKKTVGDLMEDINAKNASLSTLQSECSGAKSALDSANAIIYSLKEEVEMLTKSLNNQDEAMVRRVSQDETLKEESESKIQKLTEECQGYKSKITEMQKKEENLKEEMSQLNLERKSLENEVNTFKNDSQRLSSELNEKSANMNDLMNKVTNLESELSLYQSKSEQLTEEISSLKKCQTSGDSLLEELNSHKKENAEYTQIMFNLQLSLNEVRSECFELKQQNHNEKEKFETKLAAMENTNSELQTEAESTQQQCKNLKLEIKKLQTEMWDKSNAAQKEVENLPHSNSDVIELLKTENTNLKSQLKEYAEQASKASDLEEKLQTVVKSAAEFKGMNLSSNAKIDKLTLELRELSSTCEELTNKICVLENDKNQLENSLDDARSSLQTTENNLMKTKEQLTQCQLKYDQQVQDLMNQLEARLSEGNELHSRILLLQDDLNKVNLQHENFVKSSRNGENAAMNSYKEQLTALEDKLKSAQSLLEDINYKYEAEQSHNVELKNKLADSNALLNEKQTDFNGLEVKVEELTKLLGEAKDSLFAEKSMTQENVTRINALNDEIKSLQQLCMEGELQNEKQIAEIGKLTATLEEENFKFLKTQKENGNLQKENENLTRKCEELKEQIESSIVTNNESSSPGNNTKQQKEMETLQQSIKDKDTYSSKLKIIAVKAKKELDVIKQQLQTVQEENAQLNMKLANTESKLMGSQAQASNVQMMQIECDKLQDKVDQVTNEKQNLQKHFEEGINQMAAITSQKEELVRKITSLNEDMETLRKSKSDTERLVTTSKARIGSLEKEKDGLSKEKNVVKQELEASKIQLHSLTKKLEDNERKLTDSQTSLLEANKNMKQHDVMSLEMAQYEETICDLQSQVAEFQVLVQEGDVKAESLEKKIAELYEDRRTTEQLRLEAEERITDTKQLLDTTRDELSRLVEEDQKIRGQLDDANHQLEELQQQNEQYKIDLSSKASEERVLQDKIALLQTSNQRNSENYERKLKNLQAETDLLKNEKDTLASDYENYKVRVHSVLKQQKSKDSNQHVQSDDTELISLRQKTEQLQLKLVEIQNILSSRDNELDLLQGDYDRLLRQQQQSSESALERETRWKSRVKSLQQELATLRKQHSDVTSKLAQQDDIITTSVANEVSNLKSEHEKEVGSLKEELACKENELIRVRNELKAKMDEKIASTPKRSSVSTPPFFPRLHSTDAHVDYRSVAREAGEGEENPDQASVVSFEQLLQSSQIKSVTEMSESASVTSEVLLKQLETKFTAQSKQLEHTTEVARENESTALRLADQNKVLKEEIRRLEKNQERDTSVSNMEYLKNVVYKFVTLPPCDERVHLVPVIDMMLKLNPDEKKTLHTLALGEESLEESSSGWTSYLQRWSGMQ
ncbi:uncharacterized protein LOC143450828 [Clavelina lepadiformis]|uniref:uncharacterized protein LOC143450828 n=1 Tax=Clavelina lepadiformis TaxID=159417 RepID=UPI004042BDEC